MISYKWITCIKGTIATASNWEGTRTETLDLTRYHIRPDIDMGFPVYRWLKNGRLAQHYRFETIMVLEAAE